MDISKANSLQVVPVATSRGAGFSFGLGSKGLLLFLCEHRRNGLLHHLSTWRTAAYVYILAFFFCSMNRRKENWFIDRNEGTQHSSVVFLTVVTPQIILTILPQVSSSDNISYLVTTKGGHRISSAGIRVYACVEVLIPMLLLYCSLLRCWKKTPCKHPRPC